MWQVVFKYFILNVALKVLDMYLNISTVPAEIMGPGSAIKHNGTKLMSLIQQKEW